MTYRKRDYPLGDIRRHLETGPIVLVSAAYKGETAIMTMGWHMVMEFEPALIGCYMWTENHSRTLAQTSKECVINIPTVDLIDTVVKIGNSSSAEIDKFAAFGLTPVKAAKVGAPLIKECYANFECRLYDAKLARKYSLFVWEVVKAHVAISPKNPRTIHYRGHGEFTVAGQTISRRRLFKPEML
ncbi:hypothetical protein sos41_38020 [Alphaproteobacteria bacterium SO-S41]|nr:hypothetical protein sos41_38020 [Alphaproteobacteria bacterium SO-S41]